MKTSIVWFKTDLRLHDNETLIKAIVLTNQILLPLNLDLKKQEVLEHNFY
jgi:deoxyribodipyrimidine photo-lyase